MAEELNPWLPPDKKRGRFLNPWKSLCGRKGAGWPSDLSRWCADFSLAAFQLWTSTSYPVGYYCLWCILFYPASCVKYSFSTHFYAPLLSSLPPETLNSHSPEAAVVWPASRPTVEITTRTTVYCIYGANAYNHRRQKLFISTVVRLCYM